MNEMLAVRRQGVEIAIFAYENPGEPAVHPGVAQLPAVRYLRRRRPLRRLSAHAYWVVRRPLGYVRALTVVLRRGDGIRKLFVNDLDDVRLVAEARPDVLHAHFGDFAADLAMLAHLITGIPYTFTTHSYDIFRFAPANFPEKSRRALAHIAISEFNKKYLIERFGVDPSCFRIVHCGVRMDELQSVAPADLPARTVVAVARLHRDKGLDVLIEACSILASQGRPIRCWVAGDGPERGDLERRIDRAGLKDSFVLLGNQTHERALALIKGASAFVLPSRLEGIPVSLMEALALRTPVVTTRIYGIPELIEDGVSGFLVEPDDAPALAERIERVLSDADLRARFAEAGWRKVSQDFDLDREAAKLIAIWKDGR